MSSLSELNKTLTQHMIEQAERSTKTETHQKHLFVAMTELATAMSVSTETNTRLEEKITSLEARALDKLVLIEDSVNESNDAIQLLDKRVQILELINANNQGVNTANSENEQKSNQKTNNTWTRTLTVISTTVAVIAVLYTIFGGVPKP